MTRRQPRQRHEHDENFKNFYADGHRAFAEAVGKKTAGHGKNDERQGKQRADDADQLVAFFAGEIHSRNDGNGEPLERVVAERALELRDDERPEAASALTWRRLRIVDRGLWIGFVHRRRASCFVFQWISWSCFPSKVIRFYGGNVN